MAPTAERAHDGAARPNQRDIGVRCDEQVHGRPAQAGSDEQGNHAPAPDLAFDDAADDEQDDDIVEHVTDIAGVVQEQRGQRRHRGGLRRRESERLADGEAQGQAPATSCGARGPA
jgi:hypothetical protein